jgi:hypothetical protein
VIVEPGGVRESEGPKLGVVFIRPVDLEMEKHSTSAGRDGADSAFGMGILVMGADAGERLTLLVTAKGASPGLASKDPVIAVVGRDIDATGRGFGFELALAGESIVTAKRDLMIDLDEPGSGVVEDSAANVLGSGGFATIGVGKTTTDGGFILIHMNAVSGVELVLRESVLVISARGALFREIRTTFGFSGLTGQAHRSNTNRGPSILGEKAGTGLGAAVELTLDVTWAIQLLKMLHIDVSQARVVE